MGVYTNRSRRGYEHLLAKMIADGPVTVTRTRKVFTDKMRAATTETVGPLTVRIEPFRATRIPNAFDEKGDVTTSAYILLGLAVDAGGTIPRVTASGTAVFLLNDDVHDADGNRYRVTSPARWTGGVVEVNIELQG